MDKSILITDHAITRVAERVLSTQQSIKDIVSLLSQMAYDHGYTITELESISGLQSVVEHFKSNIERPNTILRVYKDILFIYSQHDRSKNRIILVTCYPLTNGDIDRINRHKKLLNKNRKEMKDNMDLMTRASDIISELTARIHKYEQSSDRVLQPTGESCISERTFSPLHNLLKKLGFGANKTGDNNG